MESPHFAPPPLSLSLSLSLQCASTCQILNSFLFVIEMDRKNVNRELCQPISFIFDFLHLKTFYTFTRMLLAMAAFYHLKHFLIDVFRKFSSSTFFKNGIQFGAQRMFVLLAFSAIFIEQKTQITHFDTRTNYIYEVFDT